MTHDSGASFFSVLRPPAFFISEVRIVSDQMLPFTALVRALLQNL